MHLTFVHYIPKDAHKVGQNMLEFTVYLKQFQYTCVHLLLQLLYTYEQFMDHIKLITDLTHFTFLGVRQIARQSMRLIPCVQCNHVTSHCDWWRI